MDLKEQKLIQNHFDRMYQVGNTPWKSHSPEPLFSQFVNLSKKRRPNAKVLDIGCGDSWLSITMAKTGLRVWGIDSSKTVIDKAKKEAFFYLSVFSMHNPEGIGQRFTPELIKELFGRFFTLYKMTQDSWPTRAPAHLYHLILKRKN